MTNELLSIEAIIELFADIPPARGEHWNIHTLVPNRLHLSKSGEGLFALFVEGTKESFGPLPGRLAIQHSDTVIALPAKRKVSSIRVTSGNESHSGRILAHVAYELAWSLRRDPPPDNKTLIKEVAWVLSLLGSPDIVMSAEKQSGLIGECLLLRSLLLHAQRKGIGPGAALEAWQGYDNAKRDFYRRGIAVEAKVTSSASRIHHISSLDQLAPQEPDECVYLYSVGLRQDPSAPRKLTQYVEDVEVLLVDGKGRPDGLMLSRFRQYLGSYGFDWASRETYERQNGFLAPHLPPAIFRESDLRRLTEHDFVDGKVPETVRSISYDLDVMAAPLSTQDVEGIFDKVLGRNS